MYVEKVRVQHFRCIIDSGEVPIDERLTVLVGSNESGKTAILRALWYFNEENNFEPPDICSFSGVRDKLENRRLSPSDVEIVTVWVSLSDEDLLSLGMTTDPPSRRVKIIKSLDNEYRFAWDEAPAVGTATAGREKLVKVLEDLKEKLRKTYRGRIKRKFVSDHFAWLERHDGESTADNLVLFPEWAPAIWDSLKAGDWVIVTRFAEDPYRRNTRALNAGRDVDVQPLIGALDRLTASCEAGDCDERALAALEAAVSKVPDGHPLRGYVNAEVVKEIVRLAHLELGAPAATSAEADRVKDILPEFVYLPTLSGVSDSVSLRTLAAGPVQAGDVLFGSLTRAAGLRADVVMQADSISRKRMLDEKGNLLTKRLAEYWVSSDLALELDREGQKLGLWVNSGRSIDPPSRRSAGLGSYISLFAELAELSSKRNVVVLLDDPGVYLHPIAQKKMLPLLDSQAFQVVMATHLPFMIDPDHLERVRVFVRSDEGTGVQQDWTEARASLLPVWGSLVCNFWGRKWLVVEGKDDKRGYTRMSKACQENGRAGLPEGLPIVPGGGNSLRHMVRALVNLGIDVVVLLDGGKAGQEEKKAVEGIEGVKATLTLDEIGLLISAPDDIKRLFASDREIQKAMSSNEQDEKDHNFETGTLDAFEMVFKKVKELLGKCALHQNL